MSETERNCTRCKHSFPRDCETLLANAEYQALPADGFIKPERHEFMQNFVCDNFKSKYIEYPIQVAKINYEDRKSGYRSNEIGKFVSIRPCADDCEGKTYLGLYLGDLPVSPYVSYIEKDQELNVNLMMNPAIFVFDLNKIVYGMESWWGIIKSEEDLRQISDLDIDNVWYVRALKSLQDTPQA